ncbi:MAG: rhomboid family intramembrane serine protease [Sedimentisphaerales bacterium]|nr:rhomboid family intramembrane serine protease [Sedimentisphaerales bacterium]
MIILPISTDNRLSKPPLVNYFIILINVVLFLAAATKNMSHADYESGFRHFMLHPEAPALYQFITYGFLHGSWMHIIGNMFFLYIFGNNVNDKLGNRGYAIFYLAGCIFSGFGHAFMSDGPVLGASGAVAAVTGAYMVLFPMTRINVLYVLFFVGTLDVSALFFILFKLIIVDNLLITGPGVAYDAHIAGYLFGICIPLILLHFGFLPRSQFDLWAMLNRWKRRQEFRSIVNEGYDPYQARLEKNSALDPAQDKAVHEMRKQLFDQVYAADLEGAARSYVHLLELEPESTLPMQHQMDIANKLMQMGNYAAAAAAYELFLKRYGNYPALEQVQLMLGLIYARYLAQPQRARELLTSAAEKLTDPGQQKLCTDTLWSL